MRSRSVAALVAVTTLVLSASCGSGEGSGGGGAAASRPPGEASRRPSGSGVPIRIIFGSVTLDGRLNDTSTARALADQLPLTLSFRDLLGQEKVAELPRALPLDGVPEGDDPVPGDIGYWVPDQRLVLYYGDVGFYNGIVRIGSFDGADARQQIQQQSDGFQVTVARAD